MIAPAIPENEQDRLKALYELSILNSPAEERFDRLTRTAKNALLTGYAFVNLIDFASQWCKSSADGERDSVTCSREISFCSHIIVTRAPLIVVNAEEDPRFAQNPFVIGEPGFRSYLGVPLLAKGGQCLGAFCVLDTKPRAWEDREINIILDLAAAAENELGSLELNRSLELARVAQENASIAVSTKKNLLAIVSHEIRTPMNGILGIIEILDDSELTSEQKNSLNTIRDCTRSLVTLVNDVLDFSKIEAGKLALEKVAFDPRVSIAHVLKLNRQAAAAKGLELRSEIDPAVPEMILGDPLRVGQVLLNLVGNALKFTSSGSIMIGVKTSERGRDFPPLLHFNVTDTGMGISADVQAKLFQAFAQADGSVARRFGGTGLGLMICRQLVEMMGGTIGVESVLDRGSTFSFTISYTCPETSGTAAEKTKTSDLSTLYGAPRRRILVAEDNAVNQRILSHLLGKLGQSADFVEGGIACVAQVQKEAYDIVFMDMRMPDIDGDEATRRIRTLSGFGGTSPWVVALTANTMEEDRQKCFASGMNDFLTKPITREALRQAFLQFDRVSRTAEPERG